MRPVIVVPDADEAKALFKGDRTLMLREDPAARRTRKKSGSAASKAVVDDLSSRDRALFDALRDWRLETAKAGGVPPYVIFSNRTLREMATARPAGIDAMGQLYGVGARKCEEFGPAFLKALDGN